MRFSMLMTLFITAGLAVSSAAADGARRESDAARSELQDAEQRSPAAGDVSPVLNINRSEDPRRRRPPGDDQRPGYRTIDGSLNNLQEPDMGSVGAQLLRMTPADYGDGASSLAGSERPSARAISNAVCAQDESRPNAAGASDYLWQRGQFVDHDIDLTDGADPAEPAPVPVPAGDPWFDPDGSGTASISLNRSIYDPATGTRPGEPRQQITEITEITAWVDASVRNEFATACHRYGHSALNSTLLRVDAQGREIPAGHLELRDAFFRPDRLSSEGGLDPILRGLAAQAAQAVDPLLIDDVRNFLFGPPGAGGFDLASLNIQRGRDHGLPSYNGLRRSLGLRVKRSIGEISSDPERRQRLASVYADVEDVDAWAGGLAEDHVPGALVGELIFTVLKDQFEALRDGDRFWHELTLSGPELEDVQRTRLADIIRRNTAIGGELPNDVFRLAREDGGGGGGPGGGGRR